VDLHLQVVPGLGSLSTRGLAGGDLEDLGGEADGSLYTEILVLGTLDEIAADLLKVLDVPRGQGDPDLVRSRGRGGLELLVSLCDAGLLFFDIIGIPSYDHKVLQNCVLNRYELFCGELSSFTLVDQYRCGMRLETSNFLWFSSMSNDVDRLTNPHVDWHSFELIIEDEEHFWVHTQGKIECEEMILTANVLLKVLHSCDVD